MILNNHLPKLIKNPGINFHPGINTLQGADFRKTYSPDWEVKQILPIWNDFGKQTCTQKPIFSRLGRPIFDQIDQNLRVEY